MYVMRHAGNNKRLISRTLTQDLRIATSPEREREREHDMRKRNAVQVVVSIYYAEEQNTRAFKANG